MNAFIYIDKGAPLFACRKEQLTDGSGVWNIHIRGSEDNTIHCLDEKRADVALTMMAQALKVATGEEPLVL